MTATRWQVVRDDAEIVGDQQDRGAGLAPELAQQVENARRDRDVEAGGRLVGDQQLRRGGERHGDHHALAHAAGELVRVLPRAPLRLGNADQRQHLDGALAGSRPSTGRRAARTGARSAAPTVISGLSAVRGVWEIIAISAPRICCSSSSSSRQRSRPPNRMLPCVEAARACGSGAGSPSPSPTCPSPIRPPGPGSRPRGRRSSPRRPLRPRRGRWRSGR